MGQLWKQASQLVIVCVCVCVCMCVHAYVLEYQSIFVCVYIDNVFIFVHLTIYT